MLKATDVGYSHSKGLDTKGNRVIIQSVWGEIQETVYHSGLSQNGLTAQIKTDDGQWLIGKDAIEQSIYQTRRQDRYWIETPEYRALHLFLLSEMTTATNAHVDLITGLPVAYFPDRKSLESKLLGSHNISRPGRPAQRINIDTVEFIPQGLAAVFCEALDENGRVLDNEISAGYVGLLDIGGHTVNVSTFNELRSIAKQTTSINAGMWTVVSEVAKRINAAYPGQELHGHETIKVMQHGTIRQRGRNVDVNSIIYDVVDPFVQRILGEASQVWGEAARLDAILIAGGGADVVGSAIVNQHSQARIVPNPQWANAEGYLRFGKRLGL